MSTVLGIWAHPDDEVFVSGGLMADAVHNGDRVVCLHMTRGEAGLHFRRPYSPEALGVIREQELEAALACLGVTEQRFLDYPDGDLSLVPGSEVVARIHDVLVEIRPDTVVTFGPDGFTGHPDHKSLSRWVTTAVRLWNKPRARVLHAIVPSEWKNSVVHRLNEFDFFYPGHPATSGDGDIVTRLDEDTIEAKVDALWEHAGQMQPLFDAYGEEFMRSMASIEVFRVGPKAAFRSRVENELRIAR